MPDAVARRLEGTGSSTSEASAREIADAAAMRPGLEFRKPKTTFRIRDSSSANGTSTNARTKSTKKIQRVAEPTTLRV